MKIVENMIKSKLIFTALLTSTLLISCGDNSNNSNEEVSVNKEVRMEVKDGIKTLTITTTRNGDISEEIYTGEDAEKKMGEMESVSSDVVNEKKQIRKEVRLKDEDGEKKMIVKTVVNGKEKTEVFEGDEVDEKMQEHDLH